MKSLILAFATMAPMASAIVGQTPVGDSLGGSLPAVVLREAVSTTRSLFQASGVSIIVQADSAWDLTAADLRRLESWLVDDRVKLVPEVESSRGCAAGKSCPEGGAGLVVEFESRTVGPEAIMVDVLVIRRDSLLEPSTRSFSFVMAKNPSTGIYSRRSPILIPQWTERPQRGTGPPRQR